MHNAGVMIRDPIIVIRGRIIRDGMILQESGAIEGGAQSRDQRAPGRRAELLKGPRAAAEDVRGGGFGEAVPVGEIEGALGDAAGGDAPAGGLGVDEESVGGVFGVDGGDVGLVVAGEEVAVDDDAEVGAESAEGSVRVGLSDDETAPACAVEVVLVLQFGADGVEAVGGYAGDFGCAVGGGVEGQGDGDGHKVYVADVGVEFGAVVGEFGEAPVDVDAWVARVADRGLHEGGTGVQQKGYLSINGKVDSCAGEAGNRYGPRTAWSTQTNCTVFCQGGAD